jgi:hypothetical protein
VLTVIPGIGCSTSRESDRNVARFELGGVGSCTPEKPLEFLEKRAKKTRIHARLRKCVLCAPCIVYNSRCSAIYTDHRARIVRAMGIACTKIVIILYVK